VIPETLRTDRLILRPLADGDAKAMAEVLSDWDVVKWLAVVPWPYSLADARAFIAAAAPDGELGRAGERTWALALEAEPDRLVGVVGLGAELGYWLDRAAWGRGLMTEAARAILASRFEDDPATPVLSGYFDGNEPSARVLAKLGFVEEGVAPRPCIARGEDVPSHRMRLTPEAFAAGA